MPIIDTSVNSFIERELVDANAEREATHEPSGKLSASTLYQPLRFQVLKTIGAPRKPMDAFTLGRFDVGRIVEDSLTTSMHEMGILLEQQKFLEYRGVVGYADAVIDTDKMQAKKGIIPCEVKSAANMKLKRIKATGIDYHYKLQGCFYALAMGTTHYAMAIRSYESTAYLLLELFDIHELKQDIDRIIDRYDAAMKDWNEKRILPKFEPNPKVPWTANLQYSMFEPEWAVGSDDWAITQLKTLGLIKENV